MSNAISPLIVLGLPVGALGYAHPAANAATTIATDAVTGAGATWRVSKPAFKAYWANSTAPAMAFDHAHVAKQARGSQPPRGTPR